MANKAITIFYLFIVPLLVIVAIIGAPNWYFQLLRWIVFLGFLYGSYYMLSLKNVGLGLFLLVLVLLFNPVFQFFLARVTWIFLDFVAIASSISIVVYQKYIYEGS